MALGMEEKWEEEQKASKKRNLETISEQVFGRCTCHAHTHSLTNIGNIAQQVLTYSAYIFVPGRNGSFPF